MDKKNNTSISKKIIIGILAFIVSLGIGFCIYNYTGLSNTTNSELLKKKLLENRINTSMKFDKDKTKIEEKKPIIIKPVKPVKYK